MVAAADEVADEEVSDVVADVVAEVDDPLVLVVLLQAEPSRANAEIAIENNAVRFVISRILILQIR